SRPTSGHAQRRVLSKVWVRSFSGTGILNLSVQPHPPTAGSPAAASVHAYRRGHNCAAGGCGPAVVAPPSFSQRVMSSVSLRRVVRWRCKAARVANHVVKPANNVNNPIVRPILMMSFLG
ncbi:MAG TPA: hypothetical protein VF055_14505, partial [Steroidobacteraceae bacterium]